MFDIQVFVNFYANFHLLFLQIILVCMRICITNLHKTFRTWFRQNKKKPVLQWVSLELERGEIYWLLGINGAGKTTLLQCIMWFIWYENGNILYDNKPFCSSVLSRIWYAPDATQYYHYLTAREHFRYIGSLVGLSPKEAEKQWLNLLERVWLNFAADTYVATYSAGMKKRLGIALSLLWSPDILLWDEPMNGLDPLGRTLVKDLMLFLQKEGKTILFSTHILSDVQEVCTRCWILHNGKIVYQKKITDLDDKLDNIFKMQVWKVEVVR